jgi:hypothetical protein
MGRNGDQAVRLLEMNVVLYIIQHVGMISGSAKNLVRGLGRGAVARDNQSKLICFMDGTDTARLLAAYGFLPLLSR